MDLPASVANKRLTVWLTPLDATLTKKWGGTSFKTEAYLASACLRIRSLPRAPLLARADRGPAGEDGGGEATAGGEFAANDAPFGADGGDDVAENFVDGVFVEDAEVAIGEEIHFERFELDAIFFGHVLNGDGAEVREAGLGADGGVF